MERKIGEVFEYQGKKFKVVKATSNLCNNCYFYDGGFCKVVRQHSCGECDKRKRIDGMSVIFMEVKDETEEYEESEETEEQQEEPQEEPQKLNLCEILKDCPKGEMFWSPVFGNVWFCDIDQYTKRVKVRTSGVASWYINADGTITIDKVTSPEIMLYPSRKQRDWSKFTAPWLKKEKFDPKTLQPFDRVIVKPDNGDWHCSILSHREDNNIYYRMIDGYGYSHVIPYNDDTKHIVGTNEEVPEYYRYWEE